MPINPISIFIANRGIHGDVIVYIFAHLDTTLHTEENLLGIVKFNTWLQF